MNTPRGHGTPSGSGPSIPGSPLLPLEHAALVRCYAALLAAVHQ